MNQIDLDSEFSLLVTSDLVFVGEEAHDSAGGVLVCVHEAAHKADQTSGHHRWSLNPRLDACEK